MRDRTAMKILFIGDIVGKPGRRAVRELLPWIVEERRIDLVIANCENAAAGFGVTSEVVEELYGCHIDVLTSGNHIWDKKEIMDFVESYETLLRPANYPAGAPGRGSVVVATPGGTPCRSDQSGRQGLHESPRLSFSHRRSGDRENEEQGPCDHRGYACRGDFGKDRDGLVSERTGRPLFWEPIPMSRRRTTESCPAKPPISPMSG